MLKSLILAIVLLQSGVAFAGKEVGNGGDTCENRIQGIRDDIQSWIKQGGHKGLELPDGISNAKYKESMTSAISQAVVSCTDKVINVRGVEKMCVNTKRAGRKPSILCNRKSFNKTGAAEQYVLVHHEYAGLAGLEENKTEESDYTISNQLTSYLTVQKVAKLAVQKRPTPAPNQIRKNFGDFIGTYKILSCENRMNLERRDSVDFCTFKYAEIYFSAQYFPPADGTEDEADLKVVINYTNDLEQPHTMSFLAYETSNKDKICTTYYGLQGCTSELDGFMTNSSLKMREGKVQLEVTLTWPNPSSYLFRHTSAILEKIK